MSALEQRINAYIRDHQSEAESLLETLGRIPAPSRREDARARSVRDWFLGQGAEHVWIDAAKNVICAWETNKHPELVVFMAHTDIVFPDTEALPMRRDGRRLYAPGIGDDTNNLVNLMMGAKYIIQNRLPVTKGILFIANACEEGMGNLDGTKAIIRDFGDRITEFYSFDGYLSQCTSDAVGSHRFRITIKEQGGHSYLDFGRTNAIAVMARLICDLYSQHLPDMAKTTYNVGQIEGGTTVNSIAQEASILYEYRSPDEDCLQKMRRQLDDIIARYEGQHRINVELLGIRPGKGKFPENLLESWTQENIGHIRKYYDGPMDLQAYSTDANIPLSQGILANTIGTVVGGMAHTREEWVDLDAIPTGMGIVLEIMGKYMCV